MRRPHGIHVGAIHDADLGAAVSSAISNREIYRAATLMVRHHGVNSLTRAALRADELRIQGDLTEYEVWIRIITAVLELLDGQRPADVPLH